MDERYGGKTSSDLVGNHSNAARHNGWPGGHKQSMEHSAGCMEYKDGDQRLFGSKLAHRPRPLPTVRSMILPKEETKTQRLLKDRGQTSEVRGRRTIPVRRESSGVRRNPAKQPEIKGRKSEVSKDTKPKTAKSKGQNQRLSAA